MNLTTENILIELNLMEIGSELNVKIIQTLLQYHQIVIYKL